MKRAAISVSVFLLLFSGSTAWVGTITVAADGSGDYTSIQSAVDAAQSGDRIKVKAGVYHENIRVKNTRI